MPILYFGNLQAYEQSKLRILTVAVNPSFNEFPEDNPWLRFPGAARFQSAVPATPNDFAAYQAALDRYFEKSPYPWFRYSLEPVLNGFDASFFAGPSYRTLHTDLLSPVATFPTYSKLAMAHRHALEGQGVPLWRELIELLEPHLALVSFNTRYRAQLTFCVRSPWRTVVTHTKRWGQGKKEKSRVFNFEHQTVTLKSGHVVDLLYGPQAFQAPFSGLSDLEKRTLGPRTKGELTYW